MRLHRRQADAGAREVVGAVQALEHAEQAVGECACRSRRRCRAR